MTKNVREGLITLVELGRSWLETDGWETHTPQELKECAAAIKFVQEEGGLDDDEDKP